MCNENGDILANEKSVYQPKIGWGIIPQEAAKHHENLCYDVLKHTMKKANIKIEDIDVIAFSQGPGLPPCLYAGLNFVKEIAKKYNKPLIGVNHCIAHIEIGILKTEAKDPVVCYVSGGNTQIIAYVSKRYRVFGETIDIAIGNALDTFAREAGLRMPGGVEIEKLAKNGKYISLPYVVKGMDLSYTGIITEAIKKLKQGYKLEDLCYSLQEICFAMLVEVTERAIAHTGKEEVLLTGGVAANKRLQEMMKIMCEERGAKFYTVPKEFAGDNGAMIAWLGMLMFKHGAKSINLRSVKPKSRWRTDDIDVIWKSNQ
jgi:N6-L-threonylcarbamoyladenine synthase